MKRSIKMLMLLVVLAVFVGGYFGVQQLSKTEQVTEETGSFDLNARTAEDVSGLSWTLEGTVYDFVNNGGTWQKQGDAAFPVDQQKLQTMAEDLLAMKATRKLEDVTSPADYGLADPAFSVQVTWSSGTTTTYALGDATPFADGYYLSLSDQAGVAYTVEDDLSDIFDTTMTALAVKEIIPTAENVTRITVGEDFDASYEDVSLTINPDQHWYAEGQPLDGVDDLVEAVQGIAWASLVDTAATADALSAYGLDAPTAITLYDGDEAAVTLLIGSTDDNGDYYACLPDSTMVYLVDAEDVSDVLAATAESMVSTTLLALPYEQVQVATVTVGAKTYTMIPEQIATMTDTGDAIENPGEDAWNTLIALTASGTPAEDKDGDVLLTVELSNTDGMVAGITISEYDADSYCYTMEDKTVLVSATKVDALIRAIKQLAE